MSGKRRLFYEPDISEVPEFPHGTVDFDTVIRFKEKLFSLAYERFRQEQTGHGRYDEFCRNNSWWLEDFALFTSIHQQYQGSIWSTWPDTIKYRDQLSLPMTETLGDLTEIYGRI